MTRAKTATRNRRKKDAAAGPPLIALIAGHEPDEVATLAAADPRRRCRVTIRPAEGAEAPTVQTAGGPVAVQLDGETTAAHAAAVLAQYPEAERARALARFELVNPHGEVTR